MTDYWMGDLEWSEEAKKRAKQRKKDFLALREVVQPLQTDINGYVEQAKNKKANKKQRDSLLKRINKLEELFKSLERGYYGFDVDDERIRVLGAYSLSRMKKKQSY